MLGPIIPTDELYHRQRNAHNSLEHVHGHGRRRYEVASMDFDTMPKRCGIAAQQLRAAGALLLEWFKLCLRHGWLASHRRPAPDIEIREKGLPTSYATTLDARMRHRLDLPRGAAAERLGLVWPGDKPPPRPSNRSRPHKLTPRTLRHSGL